MGLGRGVLTGERGGESHWQGDAHHGADVSLWGDGRTRALRNTLPGSKDVISQIERRSNSSKTPSR